jgi:hypothetical protein
MRVRTFLRELRGDRSLADAKRATDLDRGTLSRIERGRQFPTDEQAAMMTSFYGPADGWYPQRPRLLRDLPRCERCGEPLPPTATRSKPYHDICPDRSEPEAT